MLGSPRAVQAAVAHAVALHPYALDGSIHSSPRANADAARVWERLLAVVGDSAALASGVRALTPHAERVLVYGASSRIDDPRAMQVLRAVYALRDPAGVRSLSLGWELWITMDGDVAFRPSAERMAAAQPDRHVWPLLLRDPAGPVSAAVREVERAAMPLAQWASLPGTGLSDFPRVIRTLRRALLQPNRLPATIPREGGAVTVKWMSAVLNEQERESCFAWYLNATWRGDWAAADALLIGVLERYRAPDAGHSFWTRIEPGAVEAFTTWIKLLELTRLLGEGEHGDRVSFWRRFLPQIRTFVSNRDEEAVLICFDRWVAVQFVTPGAATYFFTSRHLTSLKRLESTRLYHRVLSLARVGEALGRYEQRGLRENWQGHAEFVVREVMLQQGRNGPEGRP